MIATYPPTDPVDEIQPDNLAYVIYTSGSTDRPKGTLVTHGGLTNYLAWCSEAYPVDVGHGSLLHSTISFDATVTGFLRHCWLDARSIYCQKRTIWMRWLRPYARRQALVW